MQHTNKMSQCQSLVHHQSLYLMELSKMGTVDGLITEHTIDGEVLGRLETILGKFVQLQGIRKMITARRLRF